MATEPVPYDSVRHVCVRAPNWVGDVVMATPALRALLAEYGIAACEDVVADYGRHSDTQSVYVPLVYEFNPIHPVTEKILQGFAGPMPDSWRIRLRQSRTCPRLRSTSLTEAIGSSKMKRSR